MPITLIVSPHLVAQFPTRGFLAPQVRRPETIRRLHELTFSHAQVFQDVVEIFLGEFAIKTTDQGDAFLARQMPIADLLELPVEDALKVMENIPQIQAKLETLVNVGLGYLHLGQSSTTL